MQSSNESVPNVRQVCVKAERDIAFRYMKNPIKDVVKKHLTAMAQDTDFQVKNAALHAL